MTSVTVVCEGYIRRVNGMVAEAHSTSTLLKGDMTVLVDTSSTGYRGRLLEGLDRAGVRPDEVDAVVNTHLHHDHVGNNDLFPDALLLARKEEALPHGYEAVVADGELFPDVAFLHTPGHTAGSMSVVVRAGDIVYVIAGDALPTHDNYSKWVPPGVNYDPEVAINSMEHIARIADIIVPGHGPAFWNEGRVTKR